MFRFVCDPSGSTELCLTEITLSGSQIFFLCMVGVWQRNFESVVCVCVCVCVRVRVCVCVHGRTVHTHTHRRFKITLPNTDKAHEKYL